MHFKYIFTCEQISVRLEQFFFFSFFSDSVWEGTLTINKMKRISLESCGLNRFQEHVIISTIPNANLKKKKRKKFHVFKHVNCQLGGIPFTKT